MRYGLIGSILFHLIVFGLIIFNFAGRSQTDAPPPAPVSVEVMSPKDYSERQSGKIDGKAEKPVPLSEVKAPEAEAAAKKEAEQKPSPKPAVKEALAPPPPPKAAEAPPPPPKPVEPVKVEKTETPPPPPPEKIVEKPAPKPVVKKEPEKKIAKVKPEPPKKVEEPRHVHERTFDPNRIASSLQNDGPQNPRTSTAQSSMEAPPSRTNADRQAAVLNRDPDAGTPGGAYEPGKPWRPASSLNDQAMGAPDAKGQMNAGSCADLVQSRIEQNWDLPIGALSAENTVVRIHIELNRDGTLRHDPTIMDTSMAAGYQAMADAAVRAALKGQPYIIPPEQFERCRDMYGG